MNEPKAKNLFFYMVASDDLLGSSKKATVELYPHRRHADLAAELANLEYPNMASRSPFVVIPVTIIPEGTSKVIEIAARVAKSAKIESGSSVGAVPVRLLDELLLAILGEGVES